MINEESLEKIIDAARRVRLDFIVAGNPATFLHPAPVTTEDFDLFVRHTPRNLSKIRVFANSLGASVLRPCEPLSEMRRVVTDELSVDFIFRLAPRQKFESVRYE